MNQEKYTSKELGKKLEENGCELWSGAYWVDVIDEHNVKPVLRRGSHPHKNKKGVYLGGGHWEERYYSAYDILNDICVKYAKEFFGEELLCYDCGEPIGEPLSCGAIQIGTGRCSCARQFENNEPAYEYHAKMILGWLVDGFIQEAEDYIWENCKFNPKNK